MEKRAQKPTIGILNSMRRDWLHLSRMNIVLLPIYISQADSLGRRLSTHTIQNQQRKRQLEASIRSMASVSVFSPSHKVSHDRYTHFKTRKHFSLFISEREREAPHIRMRRCTTSLKTSDLQDARRNTMKQTSCKRTFRARHNLFL
jgi:hypothetical protein